MKFGTVIVAAFCLIGALWIGDLIGIDAIDGLFGGDRVNSAQVQQDTGGDQ
jgi:hypothetical protein